MYLHANAKLGLAGRLALVHAIEDGLSLKTAAAVFNVSPATRGRALRWFERVRCHSPAMFVGRGRGASGSLFGTAGHRKLTGRGVRSTSAPSESGRPGMVYSGKEPLLRRSRVRAPRP